MQYTIKGPVLNFSEKIDIKKPLMLIGSCFAENIGNLLHERFFDIVVNPFGIVYNPLSIAQQLNRIINCQYFTQDDLFEYNNTFKSWQHHSAFDETDGNIMLNKINTEIEKAHQQLTKAQWLIITFGSAFYYRLKFNGEIVSNCHKKPAYLFDKEISSVEQIINEYKLLLSSVNAKNSSVKILFNISPVRYLRDGLVENNRSKSILNIAVHELTHLINNCFYFPSFEILIDELRDYRFYAEDMLHPNQTAVNYIYEKLAEYMFNDETKTILKEIEQAINFKNHRLLTNNQSVKNQHQLIVREKIQNLGTQFPFLKIHD